jgi:hypothetical protein
MSCRFTAHNSQLPDFPSTLDIVQAMSPLSVCQLQDQSREKSAPCPDLGKVGTLNDVDRRHLGTYKLPFPHALPLIHFGVQKVYARGRISIGVVNNKTALKCNRLLTFALRQRFLLSSRL